MRDCEQQADQYSDLFALAIVSPARYKPSNTLDVMMSSVHDRGWGLSATSERGRGAARGTGAVDDHSRSVQVVV